MTSVIVEADGGSRGNPGPAGYGAVVFGADHVTVLAERRESIGIATNNVAEYRGLIAGLAAAAELGAHEVDVRMDSKLVVEQMSGRWKVKHPDMIPLATQARQAAAHFSRVTYTWIPRAQNSHADRLANDAMDGAATESVGRSAGSAASALQSKGSTKGHLQPNHSTEGALQPNGWLGVTGTATRLLLLRHGETELSVQRRYSGRGNPVLTANGREQARRVAKRVAGVGKVAAVVASPLGRAQETAAAVAAAVGLSVTTLKGLTETDFGAWEGLTFAEAAERDPELHRAWIGDASVGPPGGGESFDQVRTRVQTALDEVVAAHAGGTVVVVSHVTPIKTILQLALNVGPSLLFRLHLDLASLSVADFYPDGVGSVRLVNDTSFLGQI